MSTAPAAAMNYRLYFPATLVSDPVAIALPDPVRGYSDDPLLASWRAKSAAGIPVTPAERNTFIASLAWTADMLALPVGSKPFASVIAPNPSAATPDGIAVVLGVQDFVAGDVTITGIRPAGDAALPDVPPTPPTVPPVPTTVTITTAERYASWNMARAVLNAMALMPDQMRSVPVAAAPAGNPAVLAAIIWPVTVVAIVAVGAYAVYAAYTGATRITADAHVREVVIVEDTRKANVAAQWEAKLRSEAMRHAAEAAQGHPIAPGPIETADVVVPPPPALIGAPPPSANPDAWKQSLADGATKALLWTGVATVVVAGALIGGDTYLSRRAKTAAA